MSRRSRGISWFVALPEAGLSLCADVTRTLTAAVRQGSERERCFFRPAGHGFEARRLSAGSCERRTVDATAARRSRSDGQDMSRKSTRLREHALDLLHHHRPAVLAIDVGQALPAERAGGVGAIEQIVERGAELGG